MPTATQAETPAAEAPPMVSDYTSPKEAAEALGVGLSTIYRRMEAGRLPFVKVRSLYRIPKEALEPTEEATPRGGA
jgi:excisionase family DNA binding protein